MSDTKQQQYAISAYEQNAQSMNNYQPYPPGQQHTTVIMAAPAAYNGQPIKDHLVWSIFNLILLCPILGLIAVIFSVLSRSSKSTGQWEEARSHGSVAFGLNVAGTVLGVLAWVIIIICSIFVFSVVQSSESILNNVTPYDWGKVESVTETWG